MAKTVSIKLKLPPLSVTKRSTSGKTSHHFFPRGCDSECNTGEGSSSVLDREELCADHNIEILPENLPSLHQVHQLRAVESWAKIRCDMLRIAIESEALPEDQTCGVCISQATHRCLQCGPKFFLCEQCYEVLHSIKLIFFMWEKDGR